MCVCTWHIWQFYSLHWFCFQAAFLFFHTKDNMFFCFLSVDVQFKTFFVSVKFVGRFTVWQKTKCFAAYMYWFHLDVLNEFCLSHQGLMVLSRPDTLVTHTCASLSLWQATKNLNLRLMLVDFCSHWRSEHKFKFQFVKSLFLFLQLSLGFDSINRWICFQSVTLLLCVWVLLVCVCCFCVCVLYVYHWHCW